MAKPPIEPTAGSQTEAEIRREMAQTRAAISEKLVTLQDRLLGIQPFSQDEGTSIMKATKKKSTPRTAAKNSTRRRAAAKSKGASPGKSASSMMRTAKSKGKQAMRAFKSKAQEVIGDILTGAAAGALAGAVKAVVANPPAVPDALAPAPANGRAKRKKG